MVQRPEIETARRRYERLLRSGDYFDDAHRTYFDEQSGGFVVVHRGHMTESLEGELQTARLYAIRGVWVRLLDETGQGPFADAHHGGPLGDGLDWDYKLAQAGGNPVSQAQSGISSGKKPSGNIVLRFEDTQAKIDLVNRGVKAALRFDRKREQPLAERIVVLFATKTGYFEERRTPEDFLNGRLFQGPEGND